MLNPQRIGQIIRQCRENKGLTQEQLSGLAVLDRTHYSKIERGLRVPTMESLFKIAYALDMKPHELVKIIESEIELTF